MKKIIAFIVLSTLLFLESCSNNTDDVTLSVGKYVLQNSNELYPPYVLLQDSNKFVFMYSIVSSYSNQGSYTIDKDKLILTTYDDKFTYTFQITKKGIVFVAEKSSEILTYDNKVNVVDGDKFILDGE